MTKEELETERLIFVSLLRAISEQSTYLTGELRLKVKQDFNILIKQCDNLINDLEVNLNDNQKEYLASVADIYHNINLEIRNQQKSKQLCQN